QGVTNAFQYTLDNGLISHVVVTDGRNNQTTYDIEPDTNVPPGTIAPVTYTITDPADNTSTIDFDANGQKTSEVDPLGLQIDYGYDRKGNLTSRTLRGGGQVISTTAQYDQTFCKPTLIVDANGNQTTYSINAVTGNVDSVTLPTQRTRKYQYSPQGDLTQVTDERGLVTSLGSFDSYGNPQAIIRDTGSEIVTISRTYDTRSRLLSSQDTLGPTVTTVYDALDRLASSDQVDPAGFRDEMVATYTYLPGGQVASFSQTGNGQSYSVNNTYDGLDRLATSAENIGTGSFTLSYTFDGNSNLTSRTDRRGVLTTYTYNSLNFETAATVTGGFGQSEATSISPDAVGNPTSTTDIYGKTIAFGYDGLHRLISRTYALSANNVENMTLEGSGNVLTFSDRNGRVTTMTYDSLNRPATVKDPANRTATFTYDDSTGTVTIQKLPQNVTIIRQLDTLK
ncbi:MAG: hypothetical protein ACREDR_36050, partial [Blastocatellia bacterium]